MRRLATILLLAGCGCAALSAAEVKIAVLNTNEIEELVQTRVLAKPENAEAKKAIAAADAKLRELNQKSGKLNDAAGRQEFMTQLSAISQEKTAAEALVKDQVRGELIKVVKEAAKGRYAVVLNADMVQEAVVTKDAEVVDITIDVKESLLVH